MCCDKCKKGIGLVLLIVAVVFILKDLAVWNVWNLNLLTVLVALLALGMMCTAKCPMCQEAGCCEVKPAKKKK